MIEQNETSFGAYVPDLPGCIAAGETEREALGLITEAIEFHLEGMKEEGMTVPSPHSTPFFTPVLPLNTVEVEPFLKQNESSK